MASVAPAGNPLPERKALRLPSYDYGTPGLYFFTICTDRRRCLFGKISHDRMISSPPGRIVEAHWQNLPRIFDGIELDSFTLMPNHVHGILGVKAECRYGLPAVLRTFKSFSAREINKLRRTPGEPLWQRGFYDHIVRNEADLDRIRSYIASNPTRWQSDRENPANAGFRPNGVPVLDRPLRKHSPDA